MSEPIVLEEYISGTLLILLSVWSSYCGRSIGFEVDHDILRHDMLCHVRILSKFFCQSGACRLTPASPKKRCFRRGETPCGNEGYVLCLMPEDSPYASALYLPPQPHLAHRNRSISKLRRGVVSTCFRAATSQKLSCKVSTYAIQLDACAQRAATPASADAS